jgi:hypothetical protein
MPSRDAPVVTVLGENVMTDITDTTGGSQDSRVSGDGCDALPRASRLRFQDRHKTDDHWREVNTMTRFAISSETEMRVFATPTRRAHLLRSLFRCSGWHQISGPTSGKRSH